MEPYTKRSLVSELAGEFGLTLQTANDLLNKLAEIAYREAPKGGFSVPGICKIDVVPRKERRARNPQTGEALLIPAHDAVRVRFLKRLRDSVAPPPASIVVPDEPPAAAPEVPPPAAAPAFAPPPAAAPAPAPAFTPPAPAAAPTYTPPPAFTPPPAAAPAAPPPPAPAPAVVAPFQAVPEVLISFRCKNPECRQEIEAPEDMAGSNAECPACGTPFEVPYFSEPGTLHGPELPPAAELPVPEAMSRTIRIELPDDDPFE